MHSNFNVRRVSYFPKRTRQLLLAWMLIAFFAVNDAFSGGLAGIGIEPDWVGEANQVFSEYATQIFTVGDVNNDGFDDVMVGAHLFSNGEDKEGAIFLYNGGPSGLPSQPSWVAESNVESLTLGRSLRAAGDVNGDGFDDVVVGAPTIFSTPSAPLLGKTFVYFGSSTGLAQTPDWEVESNQLGDRFARSVGGAGDVNGDGFDDIIVGGYFHDRAFTDEGGATVFLGSANGPSTFHDWAVVSGNENAGMGWSVAGAGDVNGDGFDDVIVGAPHFNDGVNIGGRAYVYHGSANGLPSVANWEVSPGETGSDFGRLVAPAGDINGDGFDDVMVGARFFDSFGSPNPKEGALFVFFGSPTGLSTKPDWMLTGNQVFSLIGHFAYGVGDVNGDGFDDIGVGMPLFDGEEADEGQLVIYRGSAEGVVDQVPWVSRLGIGGSHLGVAVGKGGDIDGDGLDDVVAGAWHMANGEEGEGIGFMYLGKNLASSFADELPKPMRETPAVAGGDCVAVAFSTCYAYKY